MPAKTPIYLKSNYSKKGKKCRLRDILSPDMISPPLGDFRHTIHIGKGGECDAFGDMSFLQGNFELLPGKGGRTRPQYGIHGEFTRANSASDASCVETPSPVLKNAISLPTIGGSQALTLPFIALTLNPNPLTCPKYYLGFPLRFISPSPGVCIFRDNHSSDTRSTAAFLLCTHTHTRTFFSITDTLVQPHIPQPS
uniref:CDC42 effector protein (Rho GTPase binding) 3 n=1 Tax=Sinocyclocheilus anshuiensis TaxID=1608454 RepID=A0A671RBB2_9TELE